MERVKTTGLKTHLLLGYKIVALVWHSSPWRTASYIILLLLAGLIPTAIVYSSKLVTDSLLAGIEHPSSATTQSFLVVILAILALRIFHNVVVNINRFVRDTLKDIFGQYVIREIAAKTASLDYEVFENPDFQDKLEKVKKDIDTRPFEAMTQVANIFAYAVAILSLIISMALVAWWIPPVVFIAALPRLFISFKFSYKTYRITDRRSPYTREVNLLINLLINRAYAAEVKIFRLKNYLVNKFTTIYSQFIKENTELAEKNSAFSFLAALSTNITNVAILAWVGLAVIASRTTLGTFTFISGATVQLVQGLTEFFEYLSEFYKNTLFLQHYFEFVAMTPKIIDSPNAKELDLSKSLEIEFRDVSFGYKPDLLVLKHLNFTVSDAQNLAIIGENGAGKTTLIKLMLRLYDVTSGTIFINGIDIREIKITSLRKAISTIFQDFKTYDMTVRENIGFGDIEKLDDTENIKKAAELSGASEFIEEFPEKYDTMLGKTFDKGVELSGGQWQKIAIARAFFKNASAVIMDEPTSALDPKSEYEVFKNLIAHTKNKSLILISHRFSTVRLADKIIVLHKGEIIEDGTHDSLIKKKGQYAKLYNLQAKWYK